MSITLREARAMLWHLRNGGLQSVREQQRRLKAERGGPASGVGGRRRRGAKARLAFDPYEPERRTVRRSDLTVAVILDDFSLQAFGFEWTQLALSRRGWREELAAARPDLLFVESAWAGNKGQWQYQLTGERGPKPDFTELVSACRAQGIPTVFWNKEDPPHYDDFLDAARLFDVVFTSDANRLEAYRRDLGHDRVDVLQFAAQPALHNPVRPRRGWHERDVAFAGMYFAHKFPERREQLDLLLGAAGKLSDEKGLGLDIFARKAGASPNYRFPAPFDRHVVGSLPYDRMLTAYKAYKVFLNANSVVDSPSMCARRIYEITAAGTSVVSTPSRAIEEQWPPEEQFVVRTPEEAAETILALARNPQLSDRQLHRAQRRIWTEHTYAHRTESVVAAALPAALHRPVSAPSVSLLVSTIRPGQLEHVFRTVAAFTGPRPELVLCTHGFELSGTDLDRLKHSHGVQDVVLLSLPRTEPLGACLNLCASAAGGDVLSKLDDDDFYAPDYLQDMLHALSFSGADVVGKQAHYMYLAAQDATLLRFRDREHRFTSTVMGPTITARREVFRSHPFAPVARGEDTGFLRSVSGAGGRIYSADRFNYVQFRGSGNHTWRVSDAELLASGEIRFFGSPYEHVTI